MSPTAGSFSAAQSLAAAEIQGNRMGEVIDPERVAGTARDLHGRRESGEVGRWAGIPGPIGHGPLAHGLDPSDPSDPLGSSVPSGPSVVPPVPSCRRRIRDAGAGLENLVGEIEHLAAEDSVKLLKRFYAFLLRPLGDHDFGGAVRGISCRFVDRDRQDASVARHGDHRRRIVVGPICRQGTTRLASLGSCSQAAGKPSLGLYSTS